MKRRVTRDVDPAQVRDLVEQPRRAALAFAADDAPQLIPVTARFHGGRHLVAVPGDASPAAVEGMEVVMLSEDGSYWFELRGFSVRGRLVRVEPPAGTPEGSATWYEVEPRRTLAWDYSTIREE